MSPTRIEPCPHCGSACFAFAFPTDSPAGEMAVRCTEPGCRASGPRRAWSSSLEEELIEAHNEFARRVTPQVGRPIVLHGRAV